MKISIIGAGNMGGAIARALAGTQSYDLTCTARSAETLSRYEGLGLGVTTDNCSAVRDADMVIFAVKPWLMEEVVRQVAGLLPGKILVSVAAGVSFAQLSQWTGLPELVMFRVIPNTAIEICSGVTFVASCNASEQQREMVTGMFAQMGYALEVKEDMMAAGTALASCGIAFAMKYIQAASQGGEDLGFDRQEACRIVEYTVKGAAELLLATGNVPQTEIDKVTTPGGMTQKGLAAMEKAGFAQAVTDGLTACLK